MEKLPPSIRDSLWREINERNITLIFSKDRETIMGDWTLKSGVETITINYNMHPIQFFLTLTHEIAHSIAYNKYRLTVKPHGKEWKNIYKNFVKSLLDGSFGADVESVIIKHMNNPPATAGADPNINRLIDPKGLILEDVPKGVSFPFKGVMYKKLYKRRTKWVIQDDKGTTWMLHCSTKVY